MSPEAKLPRFVPGPDSPEPPGEPGLVLHAPEPEAEGPAVLCGSFAVPAADFPDPEAVWPELVLVGIDGVFHAPGVARLDEVAPEAGRVTEQGGLLTGSFAIDLREQFRLGEYRGPYCVVASIRSWVSPVCRAEVLGG